MPEACGAILLTGLAAYAVERTILCVECFSRTGALEFETTTLTFNTHCGEVIAAAEPVVEPVAPPPPPPAPARIPIVVPMAEVEVMSAETLADILSDGATMIMALLERAYAAGRARGL